MPSSKNYVRDTAQEYKTQKARGESGTGSDSFNAVRHRDRRKELRLGLIKPSETVDHKVPLSKGGSSAPSNLRGESLHDNESYSRNPDGSVKKNRPKKK